MKDYRRLVRGFIWGTVVGLCTLPLSAQQESGERPKPAARVLMPLPDLSDDEQGLDQGSQTLQPDMGPVTGIQNPTIGTAKMRHSYSVPGIRYSNAVRSNSVNRAQNSLYPIPCLMRDLVHWNGRR